MQQFIRLPARIYHNSPFWAPPIWREEKNAYTAEKNVILANSEFRLFLARDDRGRERGRCLAYVDHGFNSYYNTRIGFFGAFESEDDDETAGLLLEACEVFLSSLGMTSIRGPINPVAECWGLLLEGYESVPVFMASYNPAYYHHLLTQLGYSKIKDLLAYQADTGKGYQIPQRFITFARTFSERRPGFSVRRINMKNLIADAEAIWQITNIALKDNWGYVPVDRDVMIDMVKRLKSILDPDAVWFVEKDGKPVAYALGFPDINPVLRRIRGKLLPWGLPILLKARKNCRRYRLFGLAVLPEFQSLGLDVLLYTCMNEVLAPRGIIMEANYILEDNLRIRNALEKLDMKLVKKYRIYQKNLEDLQDLSGPISP